MSRQIIFLHTETDINSFLRVLEDSNGRIIIDEYAYLPSEAETDVILQMSKVRSKFLIVCSVSDSPKRYPTKAREIDGTAIEFVNCSKGNSLSRTYQAGRLYITQNQDGPYDPQLLALYQKLSSYIRKHYLFEKQHRVYFSRTFKQGSDAHYLYGQNLGTPVHF